MIFQNKYTFKIHPVIKLTTKQTRRKAKVKRPFSCAPKSALCYCYSYLLHDMTREKKINACVSPHKG